MQNEPTPRAADAGSAVQNRDVTGRCAALLMTSAVFLHAASISGVVLNGATGAPVRKAVVSLTTVEAAMSATEVTDRDGRFAFRDLPNLDYRLHIGRDGYAAVTRSDAGVDMVIRLMPMSAVSGTVLDGDGDPVRDARVSLLRRVWERGRPAFRVIAGASTDDRGQYRVFNVPAGTYAAAVIMLGRQAGAGYPSQFWRGASHVAGAGAIVLAPGHEMRNVDFTLALVQPARVHGRISGLPEAQLMRGQVRLSQRDLPGFGTYNFGFGGTPEAQFSFNDVRPGAYDLVLAAELDGKPYRAVRAIEVAAGETLDVEVAALAPVALAGSVSGDVPLEGLSVKLVPGDGVAEAALTRPVRVGADGKFFIPSAGAAVWDVAVEGLPRGAYVRSMMLGEREVLTEDMAVGPSTKGPLNIVVSSKGAKVTGTVQAEATVVLAPQRAGRNLLGLHHLAATRGKEHRFEIEGVTPGVYKLYAFASMEPNEWQEPGFFTRWEGTPVVLKEGAAVSVTLPVVRR